jgi:monoamine oxidase
MGGAMCSDSKTRGREYQTPRRPGSLDLDDVRQTMGLSRDEWAKMLVQSITSGGQAAVYDVAIVGGGPGGAYTAFRCHKEFPDKKVILFEKTDRIGGRLYSVNHHNIVNEELGGMRIFPSVMKSVTDMVDECGLTLQPVPLTDQHNIFYYQGKRHEKGSYKCSTGRSPGEMADACIAEFKKQFPEEGRGDPYASQELRKQSLDSFFKKYGAKEEEIAAWKVYSGYDLYPSNVSASLFVKDGELYGAKLSSEQKYVKEGFSTMVKRLIEKSRAKVEMRTKVLAISHSPEHSAYRVHHSDANGHTRSVLAKQVLVSLPIDSMLELMESCDISPERKEALNSVQIFPLFKCFLTWTPENVWWKQKGFACGKSTTDLPVRQCHYYDEVDLLIYCSGPSAYFWKAEFEHDTDGAARKMFEMLKEVHGMPDMPEPIFNPTPLHKFWVDGSHKWKTDVDIFDAMEMITTGNHDESKLYLCGDAFSPYQGWVVGAFHTQDMCWQDMKKHM